MLHFLKNKILTIAIMLTPFSVFAEHTPYFKGVFGINKFNQIRNFNNFKQSSNFAPEIGIGGGAGFTFNDSFRAEVMVNYTKITFHNNCRLSTFYDVHLNNKKITINSVMWNIYKDFFDIAENVKFFAGVGIGVSQINETITWKTFSPNRSNNKAITTYKGVTNRKTTYNFTHTIKAGLDFKVSPRLGLELAYSFKNHGKTKSQTVQRIHLDEKLYINHSLYTGIRYNL